MRAVHCRGEINRSAARLQSRRRRCDLGVWLWAYLRPLRNGQRTATIALAASGKSLELGIVGSTIVHRLPHAAGMRRRGRDRQSHGSEDTHQQQNQHESGGQSMHGFKFCLDESDRQSVSPRSRKFFSPPTIAEEQFTTIAWTRHHKIVKLQGCRRLPRQAGFSSLPVNLGPPPAHPDKQESPIVKKFRLFALERVADELEGPSRDEKHKRIKPQSMNDDGPEEQYDRQQNCRNTHGMEYPVYRVLMAAGILRDPLFVRTRFVGTVAEHGDLIIYGLNGKVAGWEIGLRGPVEAC